MQVSAASSEFSCSYGQVDFSKIEIKYPALPCQKTSDTLEFQVMDYDAIGLPPQTKQSVLQAAMLTPTYMFSRHES